MWAVLRGATVHTGAIMVKQQMTKEGVREKECQIRDDIGREFEGRLVVTAVEVLCSKF